MPYRTVTEAQARLRERFDASGPVPESEFMAIAAECGVPSGLNWKYLSATPADSLKIHRRRGFVFFEPSQPASPEVGRNAPSEAAGGGASGSPSPSHGRRLKQAGGGGDGLPPSAHASQGLAHSPLPDPEAVMTAEDVLVEMAVDAGGKPQEVKAFSRYLRGCAVLDQRRFDADLDAFPMFSDSVKRMLRQYWRTQNGWVELPRGDTPRSPVEGVPSTRPETLFRAVDGELVVVPAEDPRGVPARDAILIAESQRDRLALNQAQTPAPVQSPLDVLAQLGQLVGVPLVDLLKRGLSDTPVMAPDGDSAVRLAEMQAAKESREAWHKKLDQGIGVLTDLATAYMQTRSEPPGTLRDRVLRQGQAPPEDVGPVTPVTCICGQVVDVPASWADYECPACGVEGLVPTVMPGAVFPSGSEEPGIPSSREAAYQEADISA